MWDKPVVGGGTANVMGIKSVSGNGVTGGQVRYVGIKDGGRGLYGLKNNNR
jgi:hypothetical protein